MASVPEAFYVQSVSGLHSGTNPISGDFSVGAEGLMLRDGAFAEPVREVTIASTLQRMLLDVVEVASDLTFLPGAAAGVTVLISEMSLSGVVTMPPRHITSPTRVEAAGTPPKLIDEYVGRVNSDTTALSVAHMRSPAGLGRAGPDATVRRVHGRARGRAPRSSHRTACSRWPRVRL